MRTNTDAELALDHEDPPLRGVDRSSRPPADTALEFGRFRVLARQRRLVDDGTPIDLRTRAFDLLLALLDGSLVTKDELLSRAWPGAVVAEESLKVQIFALRRRLAMTMTLSEPSSAAAIGSPLPPARRSPECSSAPGAMRAPVKSRAGFPVDFATTTASAIETNAQLRVQIANRRTRRP
jgi:hypothetical protein